jgi:fermentation-respiration switch protein FrsA (DUF1100 family)
VAALVAERDVKLKAIALLATAGRPLDAVVLAQSAATLERFGYPAPEIAAATAEQRAVYDAVRRGTRLPATLSPAERRSLSEARPWLRSHLATDPAAVLTRLQLPVLVAQGARDARLTAGDFERLRDAVAGNQRATAKLYPDLSHPFAPPTTGSLTDHLDPRAEMSEAFLADVLGFLRGALVPAPLITAQGHHRIDASRP